MKGKKWLSLALAGMLAVSALAGCGSSSSSTGGADTASTSTGSADYDLYIFNNKGENADAMAAAAEAFGEEKGVTHPAMQASAPSDQYLCAFILCSPYLLSVF